MRHTHAMMLGASGGRWASRGLLRRLCTGARAPVGHHDLGGMAGLMNAPVPPDEPLAAWELEAHALYACLAKNGVFSTDEARRTIEAFPAKAYSDWGYYEKFSAASSLLLREKGRIAPGELEECLYGELVETAASSFESGEQVRVRAENSHRTTWRRPHLRTPGYLFGATGVVERFCGDFADPSLLAYGITCAPTLPLYRVSFRLGELWSEVETDEADTSITVDLYSSWLERCDAASPTGDVCHDEERVTINAPGYHHSHAHSHEHDHEHGHEHGTRQQIERAACEAEGPPRPGSAVHEALKRLVLDKKLVSAEQLRQTADGLECAGQTLPGATLIAAAWVDDAFKQRLLSDANTAAAECGVVASNPNAPTKLVVVENDAATHNLIVCTLCSCYPASLLGPSPLWYRSSAYRARAVRRPRRMLEEEFGLTLDPQTRLAVHDSTADLRFIVLPRRPPHTDGWTQAELRGLVTRDAMLGTGLCRTPDVSK